MKYLLITLTLISQTLLAAEPVKILFGSCIHQDDDAPILSAVNAEQADLFIFLGDNIYGDTEDMQLLQKKYQQQLSRASFRQLRDNTRTLAIWDDHDFGVNDGGSDYPQKEASRQIMLDFWQVAGDSPRRQRADGIYTSDWLIADGYRIHIILPDLRWNRPPLRSVSREQYQQEKAPQNMGPYLPHQGNESALGEQQWQWLEQQLQQPADLIILGSSLQTLADSTGWESWANFPYDRERLLHTINRNNLNNILLISGDTHWGEFSRVTLDNGYELWDVTSSGLTEEWKEVSPNQYRVGAYTHQVNYGEILLDRADSRLTLTLKDVQGKPVREEHFRLDKNGIRSH
ncbi:MAG: alkaline phosphatase family protein [Pseudomonadota bacterium]|nr:alkaline phosphatase family protein [Pseudomonadota bacterium]